MDYKKHFYSGTSGLVLPLNKVNFPTEFQNKSRLEYYASLLNTVEINSTFYKLPTSKTLLKWSQTVPDEFQFTLKLSKTITHSKQLDFSIEDVKAFMNVIENIQDRKGCLLIQFPPSVRIEKFAKVQNLLKTIQELNPHNAWKIAVEFRDSSWYISELFEILDELNTTFVMHDMAKGATGWEIKKGQVVYIRLHGPEARYRGSYSDEFLEDLAEKIKGWIQEQKTVFVYFNNTMGSAFKNLEDLNKLVNKSDTFLAHS